MANSGPPRQQEPEVSPPGSGKGSAEPLNYIQPASFDNQAGGSSQWEFTGWHSVGTILHNIEVRSRVSLNSRCAAACGRREVSSSYE